MKEQSVTPRHFLGSGMAAAGAISVGGALPANAKDWDNYSTHSANEAVTKHLAEKFGVLTVRRTGPAAGDCIRATPSVYTSADDVMKLVSALRSITAAPGSY